MIRFFKHFLMRGGLIMALFAPSALFANDGSIVDALNLAPLVPLVLDTMMFVATGIYEFFVGHGNGIIYVLIWGFLAISLTLYLIKMYFPKIWVSFFGFSGGGEMASGINATTITTNMLKPAFRAIIAASVLLQLRPVFVTQWLVNPFLEFGAIYTRAITESINDTGISAPDVECPDGILEKEWISNSSCKFMVQPVSDLSYANNRIVKRGFDFLANGLKGLLTPIPHGGTDFLNVVTGIFLIFTFVSSNLFMALLIIQAIFNFGMSLVLYPFQVLVWVAKPNDKWFDIWPAFSGITGALQKLVITMIACAFILCINLAVIKALFNWNQATFVVAAAGAASSNLPTAVNNSASFGEHFMLWLSSILTFYLMLTIFNKTREQLNKYVGSDTSKLYNQVKADTKRAWEDTQKNIKKLGTAFGWIKNK